MVELDDLTSTLDTGKLGLPLPLGIGIPGRTVNANPVLNLTADHFEAVSSTADGWPTVVVGTEDDDRLGVAIDYLGAWREAPVQEADLILDSDRTWWVVVAFHRSNLAVAHADYDVGGYAGYKYIDWRDFVEVGLEGLLEYVDDMVTPILHTANRPAYEAIALQRADEVDTLVRMFDLERYGTLMERQERLFNRVVSREERWAESDTEQFDQLRHVYESVVDDESS